MLTPSAPLRLSVTFHSLAAQVINAMQPTAHGLRLPDTRWSEMVNRLRADRDGFAACRALAFKAMELDTKKCRQSSDQLLTLIVIVLGVSAATQVLSEAGLSRMAVTHAIDRARAFERERDGGGT